MEDFKVETIGNREIVLKGIGKLFYQDGLPISISIETCKKRGLEVSLLHVADELLKNGWSPKTTYNKLREDLIGFTTKESLLEIKEFCFSDYDKQREIIFKYLFGSKENALDFVEDKIKKFR